MKTLHEIERAVQELKPKQLAQFRAWFAEFDAGAWDRQLEVDVAAGRLDALTDEALASFRAGRTGPVNIS
ncbi:hypothetical protein [Longimicrobium sp.]|jgi:hypothetical protein|uniref:hypothetical protein n=1 Tax=Longimicrobium sp. TaxID=2029185 RepID=UPI002ED975FB